MEALNVHIPEPLAQRLLAASRQSECTPQEYALAALDWCLTQQLDPIEPDAVEPGALPEEAWPVRLGEVRDLLLAEQMNQGAYLAARLDGLELAIRSLLNLELQTDKRGSETLFQAIHQALSEELAQRGYSF
ncbi:MAG: hypothetical protein KME03_10170 [Aphanocapsa lilacina HA4352-LM1]|jgi:hypothetical protein|nr:hypothetical protein [Aphanocapsa lilacina HA4352-LM1]